MNIEWSERAQAALVHIYRYIAQENPYAAKKTVEIIVDCAERLVLFPHTGREGREHGTRELIIAGTPYIIIYRIREPIITVLHVFHAARKWPVS